jgi:sigma-54 dependent transcriptional regulator, acetoin dehydrogenase operon transcriptional activator AcoR
VSCAEKLCMTHAQLHEKRTLMAKRKTDENGEAGAMVQPRILVLADKPGVAAVIVADAIAARNAVGVVVSCSALSVMIPLDRSQVSSLSGIGIDAGRYGFVEFDDINDQEYDVVIALSDECAERCLSLPGIPHILRWRMDAAGGTDIGPLKEIAARHADEYFKNGYHDALMSARRAERLILENVSDGIIAHDMKRRIFYFNHAAEEITGYSRSEVLSQDCHAVFPGNLCGGKCSFCDGEAPQVKTIKREMTISTKSGESRTVSMTIKPMIDNHGLQTGIIATLRDLTKELELARRAGEIRQFSGIIGRDKSMLEVFDLIKELAEVNVPVLVTGESGTGKELVAAAIHNEGPRAGKMFIPVNCGALPEALLESELFGHVKGSFTGAIRDKKGRFELADGGTIFLDEIGDISPVMQVKLLRVLQAGEFERVGSETTMKVNVRIISATNKVLKEEIEAGRFREDLFYRLSVVPVHLPPLRERRSDIPLLVEYLLEKTTRDLNRSGVKLSREAMDAIISYDWPGNIRELQNWIHYALVKCHDKLILPRHLPIVLSSNQDIVISKRRQRHTLSLELVKRAIAQCGGSKSDAAKMLGISRATLYRFLEAEGIEAV